MAQCHHVYIRGATHDMHRLALLIQVSKSRVLGHFFKKKNVLSHAKLPSDGFRLADSNQNTHPRMSAHHEDPSKTANRSWTEQKGKCLRQFLKRKMRLGKTLFPPSDFKNNSFETFILWEIAARKLDFAASEQQGHRSDCDDVKTSVFVC